jgi:hypothetical protein
VTLNAGKSGNGSSKSLILIDRKFDWRRQDCVSPEISGLGRPIAAEAGPTRRSRPGASLSGQYRRTGDASAAGCGILHIGQFGDRRTTGAAFALHECSPVAA